VKEPTSLYSKQAHSSSMSRDEEERQTFAAPA